MKDCTRSSHSFCLADIVKSMGTPPLLNSLAELSARAFLAASVFAPMQASRRRRALEFAGLTFRPLKR
jgi:hypothetical protein